MISFCVKIGLARISCAELPSVGYKSAPAFRFVKEMYTLNGFRVTCMMQTELLIFVLWTIQVPYIKQ
jgi:hypothetical protein